MGPLLELSYVADHQPSPLSTVCGRRDLFSCFSDPAEGFGSLYLYVSMYCFLTCLRFLSLVPREGDFSYGFVVLHFSHEQVKQVVAFVYRFFSLNSQRCMRLFVP